MVPIKILVILLLFGDCGINPDRKQYKNDDDTDLVLSNHWFIAGPVVENENEINRIRKKDHILRVTVHGSPQGEMELNVPVMPINVSVSNEGRPVTLSDGSTFMEITYRSSHPIRLQAREGNVEGTGCLHGGTHPEVGLVPSPNKFTTIKIPWNKFRWNDEVLDIGKLCKFNFVNYKPVKGAILEIRSLKLENYTK